MVDVGKIFEQRAREVRDQHANGGRCFDCYVGGRCETFQLWFPIIIQLREEPERRQGGVDRHP